MTILSPLRPRRTPLSWRQGVFLSLVPILLWGCSPSSPPNPSPSSFPVFPRPGSGAPLIQEEILPYPLRNFLGEEIELTPILREGDGFSPLQPLVLVTEDQCPPLPRPGEEAWSTAPTSPVLLYEAQGSGFYPWFGHQGEDPRTCVLFPLTAFPDGATVCAGITVHFSSPLPALGSAPHCKGRAEELKASLSFRVGTRENRTRRAFAVIARTLRWLEGERAPLLVRLEEQPPEQGYTPGLEGSLVWKGTYRVPRFLSAQGTIFWEESSGEPLLLSEDEEQFFVVVPPGVAGEPVLRIIQFGHGLLGDPRELLSPDTAPLRNGIPGLWGAAPWGMATRYLARVVDVLLNPSQFPVLRDRVFQGFVNQVVFSFLLQNELAQEVGRRLGIPVSTSVDFVGISQGAILGGVLFALDPYLRRAVLHVGGGGWSAMMTHADAWLRPGGFGELLRGTIPDPLARTYLIALWQSVWDAWDPALYSAYWFASPRPFPVPFPRERQVFYPYAMNDREVPNFASETMLRSAGIPLLLPAFTTPFGVSTTSYPAALRAVANQWDVGVPELEHRAVRKLPAFVEQVRIFLAEGRIEERCGGSPCFFSPP